MTLYLVRHASAGEHGPQQFDTTQYPDDSLRPLDNKGHQQAKTLARALKTLDFSFDRLFSSPYTRAAQTAEHLALRLAKGRRVQYLDTLADDDYPQLLVDLGDALKPADASVALVGHNPFLSELASYLTAGAAQAVAVQVKKAALLSLSGTPAPGEMTLLTLLPASVYRHLER